MRKNYILPLIVFLSLSCALRAVPADRRPFVYTQPDGTAITVVLHGDEFYHWVSTLDGTVVELDENGYMAPVQPKMRPMTAASARSGARRARTRAARGQLSFGSNHFLVLLIEFSNLSFSVNQPNQAFTNLLNQRGYSANDGTGSAYDFYYENSSGRFSPTFDVYGPVKLSKPYSYYGKNTSDEGTDAHPEEALFEACKLYDSQIDFSEYDHDGDGVVDNIFFFYAGYNEAEGGGLHSDTIWPHQWDLRYAGSSYAQPFDGVRIGSYACTSEYTGNMFFNRRMCGIGTFCHEFGHVLGLPDFYDTDYAVNGEAGALYDFSTMCEGSYNNGGRTPPYFNAMERMMLGWMEEPAEMKSGAVELPPVTENVAYKTLTDTEGEYFLYECRSGTGWDAYIEPGLLVYHVDQSARAVTIVDESGRSRSLPAKELWEKWEETNAINENGSHPCFYIVPASSKDISRYGSSYCPFPGTDGATAFSPKDWEGGLTGDSFSSIRFSSGTGRVTMEASIFNRSGEPDPGPDPGEEKMTLAKMGYASIADPGAGQYKAGETFEFKLLESASESPLSARWSFDGKAVAAGASAALTRGLHTVTVQLAYADGKTETIDLEITVR